MSNVTQSGPKGYEYQYVVSLLIALQQLENDIELYIEAVGIEDVFLRINSNSNVQNIEIQVKSEQNLLTVKTLTEWLYHFEARKDEENLLKKVIDGSVALFVTQSRCSDDVVKFKKDISNIDSHQNLSISTRHSWTKEFLQHLDENEFAKKKTPLAIGRNQLCKTQKNHFSSNKNFNDAFKNVIIWEEVSHQKLDHEIETILNQKFKIPQSQCANIRRTLYEKIIVGRDTQKDVIPSIRKILQENKAGRPQLNKQHRYITRAEEQELIEKLENDNLLLLTGRSFCGKSELAKKIAIHFFDTGFSYKNWDDVQALREFFSQNSKEDKIAILEDPWGHVKAKEESADIKRRIEFLASNLPNNHKLIITSRIEILSEAFENQTNINSQSWIDLSIDKNEALIKYWTNFIAQTELSKSVAELVVQNINKTNSIHALQIGELEYLSRQENLEGKTFEELIHTARRDLRDIANSLIKENSEAADLLSILAFCSNTIQAVNYVDLAYILLGDDKYYSIDKNEEDKISFEYDENYILSEEHEDLIEYLEKKGLITSDSNEIRFTHPNYYETGRYLFSRNTKRKFEYYKRALACWNSSTTYLAATQLDIFISKIKAQKTSKLIDISFWLNSSIFPGTKDISLVFKMKYFYRLSEERQKSTLILFSYMSRIPKLKWYNGIAYSAPIETDIFYTKKYHDDHLDLNELLPKVKKRRISNQEIWILLNSDFYHEHLTVDAITFFLQNNERFIRSKIVEIYFSSSIIIQSRTIIDVIFSDIHPSVIFQAIRATFINWYNYPKPLKKYLLNKIKISFDNQMVVVRASELMMNFATDYNSDHIWKNRNYRNSNELWKLWATLFPIYGNKIPTFIRVHTPRFTGCMRDAMEFITIKEYLSVLDTWYNIVERDESDRYIRDGDWIIINLIEVTKDDWRIRENLFCKILSNKKTRFIVESLNSIIRYWISHLHITEKNKIFEIINSDRQDKNWLKASLICSDKLDVIKSEVFKDELNFYSCFDFLIKQSSKNLLACSIPFLCNFPQNNLPEINYNSELRSRLSKFMIEKHDERFFYVCLYDYLSRINITPEFSNDNLLWKKLCAEFNEINELTQFLIYFTGKSGYKKHNLDKIWKPLIERYLKDYRKSELVELVIDNIEFMQMFDSYGTIFFDIFSYKEIINIIKKQLPLDLLILEYLELKRTDKSSKEIDKAFYQSIRKLKNKGYTLKLKNTLEFISYILSEKPFHKQIKTELKSFSYEDFTIPEEIKEERFYKKYFGNQNLENWI